MSLTQLQVLIVTLIVIIEQFTQCYGSVRSGLYYDNGDGQTVAYKFASRRQRRALVWSMSNLLNVPSKYHLSNNATLNTDIPASQFIRHVYRNALDKSNTGLFRFTDADRKTIEDSDIILSYSALPRRDYQLINTLTFDLSSTPKFSNVFKSELRLYTRPMYDSTWKVILFDSQGIVDAVKVSDEGWIKLNTGKVMRRWLNCSTCQRELYLSTVSLENYINESDILVLDDPQKQPFLVGYFVDLYRGSNTRFTVPNVRPVRSSKSKATRNYLENPYSGERESYRRRRKSCALRSLHVRFRELDFDKYIVEPEGFDARYCHGECRFPLMSHMNATNHALVQTLVHFIRPSLAPRAACVPREYDNLPVFYSHDGDNYIYKIYRQMIVTSCGCS